MNVYEIILTVSAVIYAIIYIAFLRKVKKPFRFFTAYTAVSLCIFALINLTTFASGVHIPVNYCTVIGTLCGGVPFLCGVLVINAFFIL